MATQSRKVALQNLEIGTIERLAVYVLVARHGSFVEGSRRASLSTTTVSRLVAQLERELGVALLRRTTRKVALTEAGQDLLLRAGPLVESLQDTLVSLADRAAVLRGPIRVTAPAYTGATRVAALLASFALAHPEVSIELDPANALRDLVDGGFDLAIRVGPVAEGDHVARRLWRSPFGLFASKAFLGRRRHVTREELERGPCVVTRALGTWKFRDSSGASVAVRPGVRFAVNDPRAAVAVAAQGLGWVLAPVEAATELVRVTADFGEPESLELYLVYAASKLQPRRVRALIEWLTGSADVRTAALRSRGLTRSESSKG